MRRAAVLCLLGLAAAGPPPTVPAYRTFGRWMVACDNTQACEARGFDDGSEADLRVIRAAGESGAQIVLSVAEQPLDASRVTLDGANLPLPERWTASDGREAPGQLATSDPAAVAVFVAATRSGRSIATGDSRDDSVHAGAFRLEAFAFEDECGGSAPGEWLTVYRREGAP